MACLLGLAQAALAASPATSPAMLCDKAIAAAEQRLHLPAGILSAIGRVEAGRPDRTGVTRPWPYTINAEGVGAFFPSKDAAISATQALAARDVRSIDVGCVQVNLLQHEGAFAGLDQAFDPAANALYGARFLRRLYHETGSWPEAIAAYHSRTPELGIGYKARVLALWTGSAQPQLLATPRSPYGAWPPPGVVYGALPPQSFAYRALSPHLPAVPTHP
jgi:hypothetical protein